jgi:membrane protease YdiL (CAAX protease family)
MSEPHLDRPDNRFTRSPIRDRLSVVLLSLLLLLRIGYLGGGRLLTQPDVPAWLLPSEMFLTYLFTAALIYWQRNHLGQFHVTRFSLVIVLGAPLAEPLLGLLTGSWIDWPYGNSFRLAALLIAISLLVLLWKSQAKLDLAPERLRWVTISLALGLVLAFAYGWYFELEAFGRIGVRDVILKPPASLSDVFLFTSIQLMNAAVMEEPLFRGFLWGCLRQRGLRDPLIWLIQAALFWLAHIYYLGQVPFSFWVLVPSVGLAFGWLAWRSRSIAPPLIAHTMVNALTQIVSARTFYFWW